MISKVSGYAPGWMEDYGTVASALHSNYQSVRGFSVGDLTVGMTYLWDDARNQRKACQPERADKPYPGTCGAVHKDEADDFRRLCIEVTLPTKSYTKTIFIYFHAVAKRKKRLRATRVY